ncbi:PD-(D/E)XK nuclease-like domain-containing protein [Ramlibacter sp. AN1133]|uniref:PD-(D/E)XK nuclease-like domain-containing protein n=1 Tax=Ramlibacter sp. AN1133 TaxID=3133429 RepID=UPI0030C4B95B
MDTISLSSSLAQAQAFAGLHGAEHPTSGAAGDSCLYRHLPADLYHADRDALSCSLMKPLLISPAHFQASLVACDRPSDAKDFGTLVHLLVLQPELASRELAVFPGIAERKSAAGKDAIEQFEQKHVGKLVVDEPTLAEALTLAHKVLETRYRGRPLHDFIAESIPEATIYFTEPSTGLGMRIRIDAYHPDITFDLKTSRFAAARAFLRDAVEKDYDLQSYMYSLGRCLYEGITTPKPFVFVVAENAAPHSVSTLEAGPTFMGNGAHKFQACATAFKACTQSGYWPDLGSDASLDLEPWQQFSGKPAWHAALNSELQESFTAPT